MINIVNKPEHSQENGFTLIEIAISILLTSILISVTLNIFRYQVVLFRNAQANAEVRDNLRIAADCLARDIKQAQEILQAGKNVDGKDPDEAHALVLKLDENTKIAYFYGSTSRPNTFFRATDYVFGNPPYVPTGCFQPLSNTYLFKGEGGGYIRGWSIKYYNSNDACIGDDHDIPSDISQISRIDFTLRGGYGDAPDKSISSSAYLRSS